MSLCQTLTRFLTAWGLPAWIQNASPLDPSLMQFLHGELHVCTWTSCTGPLCSLTHLKDLLQLQHLLRQGGHLCLRLPHALLSGRLAALVHHLHVAQRAPLGRQLLPQLLELQQLLPDLASPFIGFRGGAQCSEQG